MTISAEPIIDLVKKEFPDMQDLMLIKSGEKYEVALGEDSPFKDSADIDRDLKYIASMVRLRYNVIEFEKVIGSELNSAINIFDKSLMMVTHVGDEILVVILKRNENLTEETYHTFKETAKKIEEIQQSLQNKPKYQNF